MSMSLQCCIYLLISTKLQSNFKKSKVDAFKDDTNAIDEKRDESCPNSEGTIFSRLVDY